MRKIFYGWWIVFSCFFIGMCVTGVVSFGPTTLFGPLKKEFFWSHSQISLAVSLRGVELGLFSPFVGFFVDLFGVRKLMIAGVLIVSLGLVLLSFMHSLIEFYVAIVIIAIGGSFASGIVSAVAVSQWFKKNIGRAMGIAMSGGGAGGIFVPIIVVLIDSFGWRHAVLILALLLLIMNIPVCMVFRTPQKDKEHFSELAQNKKGSMSALDHLSSEGRLSSYLKNPSYLYMNIGEMARFCAVASVITHVMPFLDSVGISRSKASIVAAMVPIVSVLGRFIGGALSDFLGEKRFMTLTYIAMAIGLVAFSKAIENVCLLVFVVLFSMGYGGGVVGRTVMIRNHFGQEYMGRLVGINLFFGAMGGVIGQIIGGVFYDKFGLYEPYWLFLAIFILFVTILNERIENAF